MNKIITFLFLVNILNVEAADTIRAPKFNFGGTKVSWNHRPVQINKIKQVGTIIKSEQLHQLKSHIIKNNRVYFLLDDAGIQGETGSTLICYNLQTGDSLWQKNYNKNFYGSGLTVWTDFREKGNYIEILGDETKDTTLGNFRNYYSGFTSRRTINEDGNDIDIFINWNDNDRVSYNASLPPHYLEGTDYAFTYQVGGSSDTLFTDGMYPYIWNDSLVPRYIDKNKIMFNEPNTTGIFPFGPTQIDGFTFIYFARFYNFQSGKYKHYIWRTDPIGNYSDFKDVSITVGGVNLNQHILDYEASGNLVRLKIFTPFMPYRQGNVGYLYLDRNGNIVKDQRALQIDGKHVGHIASVNLVDSSQVLHAIRFYEENNIYLYKEYPNGQFIKCGELINQGDPRFAFLPKYIRQANNKDIILTFECTLDSISFGENFVEGGWPYICKIDARELGLPTSTKSKAEVKLEIYPNPTKSIVKILGDGVKNIGRVKLQDLQGRDLNIESKYIENGLELNFDKFEDGMYFLVIDDNNKRHIESKKIIKISHSK